LLTVSLLLMAGCASPSRQASNGVPQQTTKKISPAASEVDQKVVEAHAHYAQGLVYDLDDEEDLALEEFSKAALNDPANEQLVLALPARYLKRKHPEQALEVLQRATAVPHASGAIFARLGLVDSRLGREQEAMSANQTAIKRDPLLLAG